MKYLLIIKLILLTATVGFVSFPETASAQVNCKKFDGVWSGNMSGTFKGKTVMTIKNCRVSWRLPDGRTNICRYKERAGNIEYSCSLGSHGSVAIKRNKITMQNIYTASQHGSYVVNVSKVRK